MARRGQAGDIETIVHVSVSEVLERVSDDGLLEELKDRGIEGAVGSYCPVAATETSNPADIYNAWARELRVAALCGDWSHFEILLIRMRPTQAKKAAGPYLKLAAAA